MFYWNHECIFKNIKTYNLSNKLWMSYHVIFSNMKFDFIIIKLHKFYNFIFWYILICIIQKYVHLWSLLKMLCPLMAHFKLSNYVNNWFINKFKRSRIGELFGYSDLNANREFMDNEYHTKPVVQPTYIRAVHADRNMHMPSPSVYIRTSVRSYTYIIQHSDAIYNAMNRVVRMDPACSPYIFYTKKFSIYMQIWCVLLWECISTNGERVRTYIHVAVAAACVFQCCIIQCASRAAWKAARRRRVEASLTAHARIAIARVCDCVRWSRTRASIGSPQYAHSLTCAQGEQTISQDHACCGGRLEIRDMCALHICRALLKKPPAYTH